MRTNFTICSISIILLLLSSCDKNDSEGNTEQLIYLTENAKSFFPYNTPIELTFSDSLANLLVFSTQSQPVTNIENSDEILYQNFSNDTNSLKLLYELEAWENNLHHLIIGFYLEPEPQIIDEIAIFNLFTDTVLPYFSFNTGDTTYNQYYDSIQLNVNFYSDVFKLWGTDKNPVHTVFINKELGVIGYIDNDNKLWNLK